MLEINQAVRNKSTAEIIHLGEVVHLGGEIETDQGIGDRSAV